MAQPQLSSWNTYPTPEDPSARYKYAGVDILLDPDLKLWTRQSYSSLDFLGDLGGLYDALRLIFGIFVAPLASFSLRSSMMTSIFSINSEG